MEDKLEAGTFHLDLSNGRKVRVPAQEDSGAYVKVGSGPDDYVELYKDVYGRLVVRWCGPGYLSASARGSDSFYLHPDPEGPNRGPDGLEWRYVQRHAIRGSRESR